tara:strand:- start:2869 stop:3384 length:516 start_codon:yes stop_codon:yes gene_type:complete
MPEALHQDSEETAPNSISKPADTHIEVSLQSGPVSVTHLDWPKACGAEAVFAGRTRHANHRQFGILKRLEYEVYAPMAKKILMEIALETTRQFGCQAVRLVHAQGPILPGEASVVVQIATPHRKEAFSACRHAIDQIKQRLPIWKHEIWENGRTFAQGCCIHSKHVPTVST